MRNVLPLLSAMFLFAPQGILGQAGAEYTVTISNDNWRLARVECKLTPHDGVLYMNNTGAQHLENGYAQFVRNLVATSAKGRALPIEEHGNARWKVQTGSDLPIILNYEVVLNHDEMYWPVGPDEVPYVKDDCLFWIGRALFIVSSLNNIAVHFSLPTSWRASTPWQPSSDEQSTFLLQDEEDLTEAFILIGTHDEVVARVNDTEILLAIGGSLKESETTIQGAVREFIQACNQLFGGSPKSRILIVINPYDRPQSLDGGVVGNSVSILAGDPLDSTNRNQWSQHFVHEVFHIWNGSAIEPADQEYWFSEGFTGYYAVVISTRLGFIDVQEFLARMEQEARYYLAKVGQVSIRSAAEDPAFSGLVQAGGILIAATLDVEIRKLTDNEKSLDDVMQRMFEEFSTMGGRYYTVEDIVRTANGVSGKELTIFFDRYLLGMEEMPLEEYFGFAGLDYQANIGETKLSRDYVTRSLLRIRSLRHAHGLSGFHIRGSRNTDLQDGDRLIAMAGTPVKTYDDIPNAAKDWKPGDRIELTLVRGEKEITVDVILSGQGDTVAMERNVEVSISIKKDISDHEASILAGIIGGPL